MEVGQAGVCERPAVADVEGGEGVHRGELGHTQLGQAWHRGGD